MHKKLWKLFSIGFLIQTTFIGLSACSFNESTLTTNNKSTTNSQSDSNHSTSIVFNQSIKINGSGAHNDGNTLTINKSGTYTISGSCSSGQIIIDADNQNVKVILSNLKLNNPNGPAIMIKGGHVELARAKDTSSSLSDGGQSSACISSSIAFTLSGSGTLNLTGTVNNGIKIAGNLIIEDGDLNIKAVNNGIENTQTDTVITLVDGDVKTNGNGSGIFTNGSIKIKAGNLFAYGYQYGLSAQNTIDIEGGTLFAYGSLNPSASLNSVQHTLNTRLLMNAGSQLVIKTGDKTLLDTTITQSASQFIYSATTLSDKATYDIYLDSQLQAALKVDQFETTNKQK